MEDVEAAAEADPVVAGLVWVAVAGADVADESAEPVGAALNVTP